MLYQRASWCACRSAGTLTPIEPDGSTNRDDEETI
jgi:hypothetical protein